MTLSYKHDDAYKLLLRFRHVPGAIEGFIMLSNANVFITDTARHQLIVGTSVGDSLRASVFNFSHSPYGDIFDGLCALSSSSSPMLIKHKLTSTDDKIIDAFQHSRLGGFSANIDIERSDLNLTLSANIKYPTA